MKNGKQTREFSANRGSINDLDFSNDDKTLLSSGLDGAKLWDVDSEEMIRQFANDKYVFGVRFSPDNKTIAAACHNETVVRIYDVQTAKELSVLERSTN